MTIEHIAPAGLSKAVGYSHVVTATGGRTVYVAGQGAYDASGKLVGPGDHYEQTKQVYRNLIAALEAAGARPEQVVFSTMCVVGLNEDTFAAFVRGMNEALDGKPMPPTASTLIGVERLAFEEMLVEVNAIAVV